MVPNGSIDAINDAILAGAVGAYGLPTEKTLATYRARRPARALVICWRRSPRIGFSASRLFAWPRRARLRPRQPMCTSLPGARRNLMGVWARAMPSNLGLSLTR